MAVDYNDERLTKVESDKQVALTENDKLYNGMIENADKYYQQGIEASQQYAETQKKNQQAQTDFAIEQIEQQKEQAHKDYTKEQSAAYVDWQKQADPYGVNAEQVAAMGMGKDSGYSESLQVSMYTAYQNRVAVARDLYNNIVLNYNNAIKDARLQNNSILAEIAYKAQQQQLEFSLQGFQYKNQLLTEKAERRLTIESTYRNFYQDVLDQINAENTLAEQKRQFDAEMAFSREQFAWQKAQADSSGGGGDDARVSGNNSQSGDNPHIIKDKTSEEMTSEINRIVNRDTSSSITTDYFSGNIPYFTQQASKKYGTMSNGYQPKGIMGYGEVSKTGKTISVNTTTLDGKKRTVRQNIWETPDGTKWVWDGRNMKYVPA